MRILAPILIAVALLGTASLPAAADNDRYRRPPPGYGYGHRGPPPGWQHRRPPPPRYFEPRYYRPPVIYQPPPRYRPAPPPGIYFRF